MMKKGDRYRDGEKGSQINRKMCAATVWQARGYDACFRCSPVRWPMEMLVRDEASVIKRHRRCRRIIMHHCTAACCRCIELRRPANGRRWSDQSRSHISIGIIHRSTTKACFLSSANAAVPLWRPFCSFPRLLIDIILIIGVYLSCVIMFSCGKKENPVCWRIPSCSSSFQVFHFHCHCHTARIRVKEREKEREEKRKHSHALPLCRRTNEDLFTTAIEINFILLLTMEALTYKLC